MEMITPEIYLQLHRSMRFIATDWEGKAFWGDWLTCSGNGFEAFVATYQRYKHTEYGQKLTVMIITAKLNAA